MKRLSIIMTVMVVMLVGCGYNNAEEFKSFAGSFHAQMFTDGEQSDRVIEMYEELTSKYESHAGESLYEAIEGMYNGLENGNATKYQLEVMRLLND